MTLLCENRSLLDAFRKGDQEALSEVYHTYVDDVLALLKGGFTEKQTGSFVWGISSTTDRLDCLQDIFMRAFSPKARMSYDGIRSYRNFLMTICRNRLIDHWRSKSRDPVGNFLATSNEELNENLERQVAVDGVDDLSNDELKIHWQRCLEASDEYIRELDECGQNFVALRFRQELPQFDVAKKLGLSRWKVRALEKKIQNNLRKYLQRKGLLHD